MKRSIICILLSFILVMSAVPALVSAESLPDTPEGTPAAAEQMPAETQRISLPAEMSDVPRNDNLPAPELIDVCAAVPEGTKAEITYTEDNGAAVYEIAFKGSDGETVSPEGQMEVLIKGAAILSAWQNGTVQFAQQNGDALTATEKEDALLLQMDLPSFRITPAKPEAPSDTEDDTTVKPAPLSASTQAEKRSLSEAAISVPGSTYTGKPVTPALKVTLDGVGELVSGRDYTAEYTNNVNAGKATVMITGCGEYDGSVSQTFTISPSSLSGASVSGLRNKLYTGSEIKQSLTVALSGTTLHEGTDYTVTYQNNRNVGRATLRINGTGNYTGSITKTFNIADTSSQTVKLSSGTIRVKTATHLHYRLPGSAKPYNLLLTTRGGSAIELKWTDCYRYGADIDGYIILRKNRSSGPFIEYARVGRRTTSYTDRSSKSKSSIYYYMVIGYKKNSNGVLSVSDSQVVAGVTSTNPKYNPYWPTISATKLTLKEGGTRRLSLSYSRYRNKACSTWTRWRSSNPAIATVDSNGLVTARSAGTVKIYARTANGRDVSCTVTVIAQTTPEKVSALAKTQVGYKATGGGTYGTRYSKYAAELDAMGDVYNYPKNGYDWCDIFADWCYIKVMGKERAIAAINQPKYGCGAGCSFSADYYREMGRFSGSPSLGAQVFFDWGDDGIEDHTGIVIGYNSTYVYTVEGNTGGGNGQVAARTYSRTDKRIVGYGLPRW